MLLYVNYFSPDLFVRPYGANEPDGRRRVFNIPRRPGPFSAVDSIHRASVSLLTKNAPTVYERPGIYRFGPILLPPVPSFSPHTSNSENVARQFGSQYLDKLNNEISPPSCAVFLF